MIDTELIPKAEDSNAYVFFYKMKGDYHRYISEYTSGADRDKAANAA